MMRAEDGMLEDLGLGIAYIRTCRDDERALDVAYYGASPKDPAGALPVTTRFTGRNAFSLPGTFHIPDAGLEFAFARASEFSFTLAVSRSGSTVAQGLALVDRDDPAALMVAWWTGNTPPYGVVKYSIKDERTVAGYYISKMTPEAPGEDIAIGDTASGFPGHYILNSREVSGRTWGPHDWILTKRGDVTDLVWQENGRTFCRGFGMPVPREHGAIVATYIAI